MTFEAVSGKNTQANTTLELRLHQSTPQGYLTAGAVREWFDHFRKVTLFVDADRSLLGIKRGEAEGGDTYVVSKKQSGGAGLSVATALEELGILADDIHDNWAFALEYYDDESLVVADLKDLVEAHTDDLHCEECGQRCHEDGLASHISKVHDDLKEALEDMDSDAIGEPFPPEGDA